MTALYTLTLIPTGKCGSHFLELIETYRKSQVDNMNSNIDHEILSS